MTVMCPRCGGPVPPKPLGTPGPPRKWCSDRCRKLFHEALPGGVCVDCGTALSKASVRISRNRNGSGGRCRSCHSAARVADHRDRLALVERLYNDGASQREISQELGWPETSQPTMYLRELRAQGRIGYRHRGYGEAA